MQQTIPVYVELLDEATPTLRPAAAVPVENNLYRLLANADYDPEDEDWDFLPGSLVRLEKEPISDGEFAFVVKHPNPEAIHIYVECEETYAPPLRKTYAIPAREGLYEVLPTPHYTSSQLWKFPPGSLVRLVPMETSYPGWKPLLAARPESGL